MTEKDTRIIVVGAGIVGTHCALQLRALLPDAAITIIDAAPRAYDNASCGNMGGLAISEVQPLARPRNLIRALGWIANPRAPFAMRLRYLPDYLPWMLEFVRAALTRGHFAHVVKTQEALMKRAYDAHLDVIGDTPLRELISDEGAICVYRTRARMIDDWNSRWRLARERGELCQILSTAELHRRLPGLEERYSYAVEVPAIRYWKSPAALLRALHDLLDNRGVTTLQGRVESIVVRRNRARYLALADGNTLPCDHVVIAAGAWSKILCRQLGDRVPLDTERGYSTTLPHHSSSIKSLVLFPNDEFVATPMQEGLRIGGTIELAGLRAPPDFRRTQRLVQQIKSYFPHIIDDGRVDWMGFRPSVPDGLPVIGRSPRVSNAFYAFGHGHVGLTQSAITARLVARSICCLESEVDLKPFNAARFG